MDTAISREFLLGCLRDSGLDTEIIEAVAEACVNNGIDACVLAGRLLEDNDIAAKLFLTQREVTRLVLACIKNCSDIGVEPQGCQTPVDNGDPRSDDRSSTPNRNAASAAEPEYYSNPLSGPPSYRTAASDAHTDPPNSASPSPQPPIRQGFKNVVELWLDENPPSSGSEGAGPVSGRKSPANPPDQELSKPMARFMRPTASSKAKLRSEKRSPTPPPGSSIGSAISKGSTGFVKISSRLLRLTKANQIRVTGKADMPVASDENGRPFTTEELKYREAVAEGEREKDRLKRGPPSVISNRSGKSTKSVKSGKSSKSTKLCRPTTQLKPFRLQSVVRHEYAVNQLKKQVQEEQAAEARARQFKAGMMWDHKPVPKSKRVAYKPKSGKPPQAPRLQSAKRAAHWASVIKPRQEQKEEARRKTEEERKKKEEIRTACILKTSRQGLVHQARPMPDFSEVFRPDLSCAAPPTKVAAPRLATQARLGELSKRMDEETRIVIKVDPYGVADPFAATLRL
ncbi:hypothetical protein BSKO_06412 [Bryopsis sp. KO-2023]|nr:hypothetical protein BSKO_06412 [Bryopsis sp. KO-2023]